MEFFGHLGWSHGGARVITLMSPQGKTAVLDRLGRQGGGYFLLFAGAGQLPHYQVRQDGSLERLVEAHGIVILDFEEWTAKKAELGDAIWT